MNKNKSLRVATSLMLVASTAAVAATTNEVSAATNLKSKFTDVKKGDYFHDAVVTLTDEQVLNGYGDNTFRPNVPTTRGHIAIVLTRVLGLESSYNMNIQDMPTTHNTYQYAAAAIEHGFMTTDANNNFNPKNELTRFEYAEILMRAYNIKPTYKKKHQFKNIPKKYEEAVQAVFDHGLMNGVSTSDFAGYQNITRGQMAVTLINARALGQEEDEKNGELTTEIISYNTTSEKIVTADGEFKISDVLQPLFTMGNKDILQNAIITANFEGKELVSIQDIELVASSLAYANSANDVVTQIKPNVAAARNRFAQAVTNSTLATNISRTLDLGGLTIPGKIVLKRERTTILNGTVGQIIATDEADRTLTLNNVKVKDLMIEDGYYRDFLLTLTNTVPARVTIDRDDVQLKSNQKLPQVLLTDNAYAIELQATLGTLHLMKDGYASLYGQISIDRLLIPEEAYVYIGSAGFIKEAEILDRGGEVSFTSNVRFETVTVPPIGKYEDYINYYGDLKRVIGKVKLPGSENNLFHDVIELPSKEEIQRQELFDKLVDKFEATANRNQLTIVTRLNSFSTSMRDYPVHLSFTLTSGLTHLHDDTIIPTKITFKGRTTTHNFRVANLRQGVLTVNLDGKVLTLKDLSPNSDNRLNVEFDTPFPMTVRGNLTINGYSKGASEALLNTQYIEDIQALISSVSATESSTSVKIEKRYGTIAERFNQIEEDIQLQLSQLRKPALDSKIIPFTLKYTFDSKEQTKDISNLSLAQLKSGVSLYSLLGVNERKLLTENGNKIEEWNIQFNDTIDADFKVLTSIQGINVKSTSFKINYENTAKKAVKDLQTTIDKDTLTLTKTYNSIDSTLVNKAQDVKMTLTKATTPASDAIRVPFTMTYKLTDGQELTETITDVTIEELKKGVSLYTLLNTSGQPVAAELAEKVETFEMKFKEQFVGDLRFDAIVNNVIEQSTTAAVNSQITVTPSIAKLELAKLNRGFKIEKTYGDIQSIANGRTQNLTFKVLSSTLPTASNSNVQFKIKYQYDGMEIEQTFNDKSLNDLKAGISIYSLLGLPLPKLGDTNSGKVENIEIEFTSEFAGKLEVAADVETEQTVKKIIDAGYTGVAVENLTLNNLANGIEIEQQFGNPISEKFYDEKLDTMLKLQTTLPNDYAVPFTIQYVGVAGTQTESKNLTVAALKAGVSLYELLGKTAPTLTSSENGLTEKFTITFSNNIIGKFNIQSLAGEGNQAKVVAETGFKDVYVAEAASGVFSEQVDGLQLKFKRTFHDFSNEIVGSPLEVKLQATAISNLTDDDTINIAVKRNNEQERVVRNVKVSELKSGKSLYSLIGVTQPKLEAANKGKEETWTVRFLEVVDGQFKLDAEQGGKLINSSNTIPFASTVQSLYSIDAFTSAFLNYQLTMDTKYGTASTDSTIKEYSVDMLLKATSGLENEQDDREIKLNIRQGATVYTEPFKVTVKDLKAGIKLSKILGKTSLGKLGAHSDKIDQWAITIHDSEKTPFKAQLDTTLLVNDKKAGETKNILFENKAATLNSYVDNFKITSTPASSQFTTELKFKDRTSIASTFGYLPVDAKLIITAGTLQNEMYAVTILANSQLVKKVEVSPATLQQGIKLSSLAGLTPATLSEHASEANWTFQVESIGEKQDGTVSAKIDLLVGEYTAKTAELKDFSIKKSNATSN